MVAGKEKVVVSFPTMGLMHERNYRPATIPSVVKNTVLSIQKAGFEPVVVMGVGKKAGLPEELRSRLGRLSRQYNFELFFEHRPDLFWTGTIFNTFNKYGRRTGAKFFYTSCDDFVGESKKAGDFITPLASGKVGVTTGAWGSVESALSFPKQQYQNERNVSVLMNYAHPLVQSTDLRVMPVFRKSVEEGKAVQAFSGIFAFEAGAWSKAYAFAEKTFGDKEAFNRWGGDPAILLSALHTGATVLNVPIPRRFEHNYPRREERGKFAQGRLVQFNDAVSCIRDFLKASGQEEKIPHFDKHAEVVRKRIEAEREWKAGLKKRLMRTRK
ncbi:hypothetical protein HY991_04470 [Candidatus Micrarchaeota archaeon]|nr:hypothetical protein [Candidatus Micrarchaeota archaeon]